MEINEYLTYLLLILNNSTNIHNSFHLIFLLTPFVNLLCFLSFLTVFDEYSRLSSISLDFPVIISTNILTIN